MKNVEQVQVLGVIFLVIDLTLGKINNCYFHSVVK